MEPRKSTQPQSRETEQEESIDVDNLSYVRLDAKGRVIAVFSDDSEMDVSELLSLSLKDD